MGKRKLKGWINLMDKAIKTVTQFLTSSITELLNKNFAIKRFLREVIIINYSASVNSMFLDSFTFFFSFLSVTHLYSFPEFPPNFPKTNWTFLPKKFIFRLTALSSSPPMGFMEEGGWTAFLSVRIDDKARRSDPTFWEFFNF